MDIKAGKLLRKIDSPEDLKKLKKSQLVQLSAELRQFIIESVSKHGGHFGASMGVVEMTVALHYVFDTPRDLLVWDVGHQAYGHKILTGRRDVFHTNRKYTGISGFTKRSESEYDPFGAGHASTSISATLGMAVASKFKKDDRHHIAVIGDGAMTAGLAFEALNHGGVSNSNLLVILNDNCMSIDANVGALKEYLTDISTSRTYNKVRDEIWKLLGKFSKFGKNAQDIASKLDASLKGILSKQSNIFQALNFRYFGPIDGHNVNHLVDVLEDLKKIPGPKLLHCVTVKGKGFKASEEGDQTLWHAPGVEFDTVTGELFKAKPGKPKPPKYQDVFGKTIIELAKKNKKIMGVTPAMPTGSSLKFMMEEMPERAFDVGIAEQHAVTFSAGLAVQGMVPFCNIYSSFMQRAYDQVVHDVTLQNLHVIFCLDRGGLAGADGPTHHGAFDFAYMRCLPNMVVSAPMNETELRDLMYTAQLDKTKGPFTIRYPRGQGVIADWQKPMKEIKIGTGRKLTEGEDVAILTIGHPGNFAVEAIQKLNNDEYFPAHYDLRFVKPLDEDMLHKVFSKFNKILTVEDGCLQGGMGSAVLEFMAENDYHAHVKRLGIPDRFIEHGSQPELWAECGFYTDDIMKAVKELIAEKVKVTSLPSLT